ncbi:CoA transferase, partial [Myxococcota bacterium]|nr:CoA transferase [Myxococcota bacterium]
TRGFAGPFGVKQLADQGADVVKIERPGGDPMRRAGPFLGDNADEAGDPEQGGLFLYLNTNRRGIVLDLKTPQDRDTFRRLALGADLVVESYRPGTLERLGIGFETLGAWNPRLSLVSLSNFGDSGPYRDWALSELVSYALAGPMYPSGLPGREPLASTENATLGYAGLAVAAAALAAVIAARRDGRGHYVSLSIVESFLAGGERQPLPYFYNGEIPRRIGDPLRAQFLMGGYACGDGYVAVQGIGRGDSWWPRVFKMMGMPELSSDPRFANATAIAHNKPAFDAIWSDWLLRHTRREIFDAAAEARFPMAPVYTAADMFVDPHFVARGIFEELVHPVAGRLRYPAKPFRLHGASERPSRPAPLLGQHQAEVMAELERAEQAELAEKAERTEAAAARTSSTGTRSAETPAAHGSSAAGVDVTTHEARVLPLAGIRVLELAEGWAGPMTGMWLGDLGAEVIKVEAVQRFDHARGPVEVPPSLAGFYPRREPGKTPWNVNSGYVQANRNKLGMTLDLSRPKGVELFKRLVAVSDVVVTNMVTGVPEKMGIGWEVLSKIRPNLVMLSCSGFGLSGPYAKRVTMGGAMDGIAGYGALRHYPDEAPDTVNYSTRTDVVTGMTNAVAILAALARRERSGSGQQVEVSGVEASLHHVPEALMEYAISGRIRRAAGNDHPWMAPHGVFACAGEDRWIAISVYRDEQWGALCAEMGDPAWACDARFADRAGRLRHRDELARKLGEWTRRQEAIDLMERLQSRGVPAAAVHDAADHARDPHFLARGFHQPTELPGYGTFALPTSPWVLDRERLGVRLPPPGLGEHDARIYAELLGLSAEEIEALRREDYLGCVPLSHAL